MTASLALLYAYRLMAIIIAAMMVYFILKPGDWKQKLFASMVFVPFVLRGFGIK